jgi:hypothetical protein
MTNSTAIKYYDYILIEDEGLVREIQNLCADIAARTSPKWGDVDVIAVTSVLNRSPRPRSLFRFIDERTGSSYVGYRTRDDREWFHILRQMRNDSSLFHELLEADRR